MIATSSLSIAERDELRAAARGLLSRDSSSERVRAVINETPGFDGRLWDEMVELGWTSLHVPTDLGGGGAGYAELGVMLHELGRAIVPSPFLASSVLASGAFMLCERRTFADEMLASIVAGDAVGSVALANAAGSYDQALLSVEWEHDAGSIRLSGSSGFVLDADCSDIVVVAARDAAGAPAVVAVDTAAPGVRVEHTPTVDATHRLFTVSFRDVVVPDDRMLTEHGAGAGELLDRVLALGVIAAASDATGVAERALGRAADYAKDRVQFGKPIGSFQAVKHHCANMAIAVEASRAAVRAAWDSLDRGPRAWPMTAAVVSSYVGPACAEACALALRVHGGLGFTWEHDSHLFLKRAKLDEVLFGTPSWHRRRLAREVIGDVETPEECTA